MTNNTNTELKEIKTYTTEELIEIAKKVVYNRIPEEVPTTTEWNEEKQAWTYDGLTVDELLSQRDDAADFPEFSKEGFWGRMHTMQPIVAPRHC